MSCLFTGQLHQTSLPPT